MGWSIFLPKSCSPLQLLKTLILFPTRASQLLYQLTQSHTVGTIREELCKELLLAQKLYHLCHPQYSGKAERAKGILKLKLAKFSETLSSFGQITPLVLIATWFTPSRTHQLPYDLVMPIAYAFRDFTSATKSCPATHRHGKILQGTHVPPPPSLAGEGCLPTTSF